MSEALFYHNPKCSKSRKALEIIDTHNINTKVIFYLKDKITKSMLKEILDSSGLSIRDIIRSNEKEYKENNIDNLNLTKDELLDFILKYPKLLQRPVFVFNNKAIIGRPPEDVLEII
jgi:arsenate reductase